MLPLQKITVKNIFAQKCFSYNRKPSCLIMNLRKRPTLFFTLHTWKSQVRKSCVFLYDKKSQENLIFQAPFEKASKKILVSRTIRKGKKIKFFRHTKKCQVKQLYSPCTVRQLKPKI